jgi:4-hydroxy-tetrahydrodipicolinate synthase
LVARRQVVDRLRGGLVPAVLTPLRADAALSVPDLERYASGIAAGEHGGISVWAHTGRGPYLSEQDRATVLRTFRAATDAPIIVGISSSSPGGTSAKPVDQVMRQADLAAELGGDALMVFPPPQYAAAPDRDRLIAELHEGVADRTGLPLVLFYLHAEAGGYPYPLELLRDLLGIPLAAGIKLATLDSAMTCQDVIALVHEEFPDRLAITGEDRMFGPSLMWGADAALVGIAAAAVRLTAQVMNCWFGDRSDFIAASTVLDEFARVIFRAPMEGYIQRMLWVAEDQGLIGPEAAFDPYGPPLAAAERAQVLDALRRTLAVTVAGA